MTFRQERVSRNWFVTGEEVVDNMSVYRVSHSSHTDTVAHTDTVYRAGSGSPSEW